MRLINERAAVQLLLVTLLAGVVHAQAPAGQTPPSSSSSPSSSTASTPAQKTSAGSDQVIIKVGDAQITREEFESRVGKIEGKSDAEAAELPQKERRKLGDDYASVLLLSKQALDNHLDSTADVREELEIARIQVLSDAEFARLMHQADPTPEEIKKYYSDHLSDYEQVHIRRLFIWKRPGDSKDGAVLSSDAARARAEQVRKTYESGTDVKKLSEDLRKSGEGMLDAEPLAFVRGGLSPDMEKAAFALKKQGEWSEAVDTPAAALFIELDKRDYKPLTQVSSRIEKDLQGDKLEVLLDNLKKKAGIWLDEKYFGAAVAPVPGAQQRNSKPPSQDQKSARKGESNNDNETQK
jgi:hypothetical protein